MNVNRYVNETEAAKITGLAVKTLQNYRYQKREIPFVKVGTACRYSVRDLEAFMESKKVKITIA